MNNIILQNVELKDLENLIRRVLKEELASISVNLTKESVPEVEEPLISKGDAAKTINVSLPTFSKMIKEGVIKTYRVGRRNKFKKTEMIQSLQQSKARCI